MKTAPKPKIVQIVPAQDGWYAVASENGKKYAKMKVALWALREDGSVVGLSPGFGEMADSLDGEALFAFRKSAKKA